MDNFIRGVKSIQQVGSDFDKCQIGQSVAFYFTSVSISYTKMNRQKNSISFY